LEERPLRFDLRDARAFRNEAATDCFWLWPESIISPMLSLTVLREEPFSSGIGV
jgi:hypothetical protein